MNVSGLDINISDYTEFGEAVNDAIERAAHGDATWFEVGGTPLVALVPCEVLRFYARFNDLVPEHEMHHLDGPRECDRCHILRENADWLFNTAGAQTADTAASVPVVGSQNQGPSTE